MQIMRHRSLHNAKRGRLLESLESLHLNLDERLELRQVDEAIAANRRDRAHSVSYFRNGDGSGWLAARAHPS